MGVITVENQLIVYTPKKNVKKIILIIFLGIVISIVIFIISAFYGATAFFESKWHETDYVDLNSPSATSNSNQN